MKVGIIGTGEVGRALAKGFLDRDHQVMMGSRDKQNPKLQDWVASAGQNASGGSFEEAAAFGEVVVLATRGMENRNVLRQAGPDRLAGKLLIDATNPLVMHENGPPTLGLSGDDSGGEEVQRLVPEARVVKCFNIVGNPYMVDPALPGGPPTMFIAGNDPDAKAQTREILDQFGWSDVYDVGGIEGSRYLEAMTMAWVAAYMVRGNGDHAFKLIHK